MIETVALKRGDTLSLAGHAKLPSGTWTAASSVRRADGTSLVALDVQLAVLGQVGVNGETHSISLFKTAAVTSAWPLEDIRCDVRFTDGSGMVIHSPTFLIAVTAEVTSG